MNNQPFNRSGLWYFKFLFALFAAGFASWLLVLVISLPFGGFQFVEQWLVPFYEVVSSIFAVAWSPLVWRKLR
jgi:hypothetical protein